MQVEFRGRRQGPHEDRQPQVVVCTVRRGLQPMRMRESTVYCRAAGKSASELFSMDSRKQRCQNAATSARK